MVCTPAGHMLQPTCAMGFSALTCSCTAPAATARPQLDECRNPPTGVRCVRASPTAVTLPQHGLDPVRVVTAIGYHRGALLQQQPCFARALAVWVMGASQSPFAGSACACVAPALSHGRPHAGESPGWPADAICWGHGAVLLAVRQCAVGVWQHEPAARTLPGPTARAARCSHSPAGLHPLQRLSVGLGEYSDLALTVCHAGCWLTQGRWCRAAALARQTLPRHQPARRQS